MGTGTDVIRQDIDALRDSMSETIVEIEDRVKGTVDTTVEKVKRTFDLRQQVIDQPFMAIGAAVVVGFVVGSMGNNDTQHAGYSSSTQEWRADVSKPEQPRAASHEPGLIDRVREQFGDEINMLTSAGVAVGVNMLRDTIQQYLPRLGETYQRMQTPQAARPNIQPSHMAYASSDAEKPPINGSSSHRPVDRTF
jgi:ElaB/YqjD/DUF883 family membrane-anchored ribosome-binding protein